LELDEAFNFFSHRGGGVGGMAYGVW
jgi:hypothetical protein